MKITLKPSQQMKLLELRIYNMKITLKHSQQMKLLELRSNMSKYKDYETKLYEANIKLYIHCTKTKYTLFTKQNHRNKQVFSLPS